MIQKKTDNKDPNFKIQAEQTPELEDIYKPTLLETTDSTSPWRRPRSPQVYTTSHTIMHHTFPLESNVYIMIILNAHKMTTHIHVSLHKISS